ncbi:MAG: hypothetical protein LIP08_14115 [Bacteroides sp.]|nr:hypothetical protein [Bacteroides sp.]
MKTYKFFYLLGLSLLVWSSCTPDDRSGLEEQITDLKIIILPGEVANTYTFKTVPEEVIGFWDLGNGATAEGVSSATGEYPFPGNYTVTLEAFGQGGKTNTVTTVLPVVNSNFELLSDPIYEMLTGGINNPEGKTWVVDSLLPGHLIKNPQNGGNGDWAAAPAGYLNRANNKTGGGMYDDEITFKLTDTDGPAFIYNNHGSSCAASNNISSGNPGAGSGIYSLLVADRSWRVSHSQVVSSLLPGGCGDYIVNCIPPENMTWTIIKDGAGNYTLNLPKTADGNGGFLFYFTDWSAPYQIKSITPDKMVVWKSCTDGATRQIVMIRKGYIDPEALPEPAN